MHKQSKKQDIELAALMFLLGLLLFFYPVVTQVSSYQADEEAYEDLAMEYMPPEFSPGPVRAHDTFYDAGPALAAAARACDVNVVWSRTERCDDGRNRLVVYVNERFF